MKSISACAWAAIYVAVSTSPAFAQNPNGPVMRDRPVEINIGATGVLTWITSGGDLRPMISFPVGERISLEVFGGPYWGTRSSAVDLGIRGFYGVQVKREIDLGRRAGVTPFLTFGATGVVSRDVTYTCSYVNTVATCHPHETTQVLPPIIGLFGGGVQWVVTSRLAVRVEAQGVVAFIVPLGLRVSVGISVPLGHQYASSARAARSR